MDLKLESLWIQLTSNSKLDRDRGNQQLELDLKTNKDFADIFVDFILHRSSEIIVICLTPLLSLTKYFNV